jgi:hypothetical protein
VSDLLSCPTRYTLTLKIKYNKGIKKLDYNTFISKEDKNLFFKFLKELSLEELDALRNPKY